MGYLVLVDENIIKVLHNTKLLKQGPEMRFFNRIILPCIVFSLYEYLIQASWYCWYQFHAWDGEELVIKLSVATLRWKDAWL